MRLGFILTTWLFHMHICTSQALEDGESGIAKMFNEVSEKMMSSLMKSLSAPLERQKRDLKPKQSLRDDSGVSRVISVNPVSKLCQPAIRTLFLDVLDKTYAICITVPTANSPWSEVVVGNYLEHKWTPIHSWIVSNAVDVAAFYYKSYIYVIVSDTEKDHGPDLVKINIQTNAMIMDHEITGYFSSEIALWKMKRSGKLNLALANLKDQKDGTDINSEIFIYEWTGTYFDRNATVLAYDVKDIEPFHVHGVAYIAVANFRRGRNKPKVDSEIFRYDQDTNRWVSHQKIATYGAMDWEFFTLGTSLGQEFFLAVANKGNGETGVKSMIYKFVEDRFVPFQCLPTTRATSFASYSRNGLFILAVANEDDAVYLYQYDGWRFVMSGVQSTKKAMSEGAVHLEFHKVMRNTEEVLILSVANPRHPWDQSVFEVSFVHENLLDDWYRKSEDWCFETLSKLEVRDIDKILDLSNVIYTDNPIIISQDIVFEQGFEADALKSPKVKELSTQRVFDVELLQKLASLEKRLDVIKQKLAGFSEILSKALRISGDQTIESDIQFQDAILDCKNNKCEFNNINTERLNGESIVGWEERVVFTNSNQPIKGTLMSKAISAPSINVSGSIDGVKPVDLVTKSGTHTITARKIFKDSISAKDVHVSGFVDGIVISPSTTLLATGHQEIEGNVIFDSLNTTWLTAGYVNQRNLTEFFEDLVLEDKSYEIKGEKTFSDVTVDNLFMTPGAKINGIDLVDLWNNALWTHGKARQEVNAEITFAGVMFEKDVYVASGINGVEIPGPRIIDTTEPATINAPKTFTNSTSFETLQILNSLNGLSMMQAPDGSTQLDMMLKTGDQIITGRKTFHTIHLDADSDVKGNVDGVDLSELETVVLRKNNTSAINGTWIFNNLVIRGPLTIAGTFSGKNLSDILQRALKIDETNVPEIVFEDYVYVKDLQAKSINDIVIDEELVSVNKPQIITGKKTFQEIELLEDTVVLGLVNNINLTTLNDILLVIGNQHIESKKLNRDVVIQNLVVEGTINNIPISDILTAKGGQINGPRTLKNVTFSEIVAKNIEVTGKVNDVDIKAMIDDTMTFNGNEEVTGEKVFENIHIMNDANLLTADLNGVDLKALWDDAVFIDVPQEINGKIIFEDGVVFNNLSFKGTLDGVSDWEISNNWMLRDKPQTVESNTIFTNGFAAKDLNSLSVNGLDLKSLESSIVKVNEESEITGPIIFENTVTSTGNIGVTGKVQGIDLSEEVVLKDSIIVSGKKTFLNDIFVNGDLYVDGLINNIDIEDLCNKTFLNNKDINITRLVIKGDVTLEEGTVDGNLAGVDIQLLKEAAVRNDGSEILFSGVKTFNNVTFDGPVVLKGKFGQVDLKELAEKYMSLSKDQNISGEMTFEDLIFKDTLSVINLDTETKEINNINLTELYSRILRTSTTQTITAEYFIDEVRFENDVMVVGEVNGCELPDGVMRRGHINYIQSPKIFGQPLIVNGNLDMEIGKTIQDVDVSDWFKKTVFTQGNFQIHGQKIFNKLSLNDVTVKGTIDSVKVSEDSLLMVYGNQLITGKKVVTGEVNIDSDLRVNGLINMINVTELEASAVQRNIQRNIIGYKSFIQPLTTKSLQAPSIAGIDIGDLQRKLNTSIDLNPLENRLVEMQGVVSHLQMALENQAVLLQYYELFDEFAIPSAYDWHYVYGPECGELLLLAEGIASEPCSSIRIFGYDNASSTFIPAKQELKTSFALSVKTLTLNSTLVFVANKNPNLPCSGNSILDQTTVDIYEWRLDKFYLHHSLQVDHPADMAVFKDGVGSCMVLLEEESKVYCNLNNVNWTLQEVLFTKAGLKASVLQSEKTILAIAAPDTSFLRHNYEEGQIFVDIYLWNSSSKAFSAPRQEIKSLFAQSIVLMEYTNRNTKIVFLAISEGSMPRIFNKPKIHIYKYDDIADSFVKYQEIIDGGNLEWLRLKTGELLLFVVDSMEGLVKVFQYKGTSGFVKIDAIKSVGTTKVHAFIRSDPEDWLNHYLALAGPHATLAQPTQGGYYAKILKSKVKGKRQLY